MMKPKLDAWHGGPKGTEFRTVSYIDAGLLTSSNSASPQKRARCCSSISMRESVGITLHQEAWSGRLFDKDFAG
jgi:hypothetical protein